MKSSRIPRLEHYSFETIHDGISFGYARSDGTALSNTGVVDLGGSTLLFDTSLTLRSAREIRAVSLALTGRPPSLSVNSHWHVDHILGNQVFSDRPIYATKRTIEIVSERRAELENELGREKLEADIREFERQRTAATSDFGRAQYDDVLRINRTLLEEAAEIKITPPSREFESELDLPGQRKARLLTFGSGHTESDAILFLPKERVVFAGDLVVAEHHPNLTSGDPEHWLTVLGKIAELRPERIVTGHGPLGSPSTLAVMRDYLETVLELARESGEPTMPPRFGEWVGPDQFAANVTYARRRLASSRGSSNGGS